MKDGTMFSTIEPKNNVLPILISHFKNRMKRENLQYMIKEENDSLLWWRKSWNLFVESLEIEWSDEEIEYSKLWKTFHKTISIKERENKNFNKVTFQNIIGNILLKICRKEKYEISILDCN